MTREELKEHCEKQIKECEIWSTFKGEEPHGKVYEEHKLILELLTQEPKMGHWIVSMDCEGKTRQCTCDLCGYETGKHTWKNPNFCENCGAKMEGVVE